MDTEQVPALPTCERQVDVAVHTSNGLVTLEAKSVRGQAWLSENLPHCMVNGLVVVGPLRGIQALMWMALADLEVQ